MAEKNIKEAEGYLKAKIDNQELNLRVCEIIRQETYITLNQETIDISLGDDINFSGTINTPEESLRYLLNSGTLYITIKDSKLNEILKTTVLFENRNFEINIPNTLPIGDYSCKIEYFENKYFLGCTCIVNFKVKKRAIGYKFDKTSYIGYPNQTLEVQMYLYDYKTKLPLSTPVSYKFTGKEYLGQTDKYGYITMNITIPDVIKENCKSFVQEIDDIEDENDLEFENIYMIDTKGWVYQNGQLIQWFDSEYHYYVGELGEITTVELEKNEESDFNKAKNHTLEINVENDNYIIYPISLKIYVQKSPTTITLEEQNKIENNTRLIGSVEGAIGRVKYGELILEVQNELEKIKFYTDEYGNFDYCYNPINAAKNSSNNLDNFIEGVGNTRHINVQVDLTVNRKQAINVINDNEYGKMYVYNVYDDTQLRANATVKTIKNNKLIPIKEGMVCFIIYRQRYDGTWVRNYRYSEEITDDGEAEIAFNLSTEGKYYIYAEYYGMFEYNNAVSKKQYYKVINDDIIKLDFEPEININVDIDVDEEIILNNPNIDVEEDD